jgi:hypothetical protein
MIYAACGSGTLLVEGECQLLEHESRVVNLEVAVAGKQANDVELNVLWAPWRCWALQSVPSADVKRNSTKCQVSEELVWRPDDQSIDLIPPSSLQGLIESVEETIR